MKKIKYIFVAAALGLTMSSCYDLDLEPKGLIYENVLMKSESGLQKYWAMVFQDLPIEDFNFAMNGEHNGFGTVCAARSESVGCAESESCIRSYGGYRTYHFLW